MAHMVRLNVGGQRFEVGRSTLSRVGGYLATLIEAAEEEEVFVDRDPTLFRFILGWLRDGDNAVLPATAVDRYTALQKNGVHVIVYMGDNSHAGYFLLQIR